MLRCGQAPKVPLLCSTASSAASTVTQAPSPLQAIALAALLNHGYKLAPRLTNLGSVEISVQTITKSLGAGFH